MKNTLDRRNIKVGDIIQYPEDRYYYKDYQGSKWLVLTYNNITFEGTYKLMYRKYYENDAARNLIPRETILSFLCPLGLTILKRSKLPSWF